MDEVIRRLRDAGFRPGVAPWLGGVDTQYTRIAEGRITTIVLAALGPWIVLHGRADHLPHPPYTHYPMEVDRRDLTPQQAIHFVLGPDSPDHPSAEESEKWPQEEPNDQ